MQQNVGPVRVRSVAHGREGCELDIGEPSTRWLAGFRISRRSVGARDSDVERESIEFWLLRREKSPQQPRRVAPIETPDSAAAGKQEKSS